MAKAQSKSRSPLKSKPVRTPGQSLHEARIDLFEDKVMTPFLIACAFFMAAIFKWTEEWTGTSTSPWILTAFFLLALCFLVYRIRGVMPTVRNLRQAEDGEKAVGQYLERLREQGYHVFHDVVGDNFNIDHVLIGPGGVFTIETKTWSKPERGEAKIEFDGLKLTAWGREPERNPLIQARAQAGWLNALLRESTGQACSVKPVIVFPGWYVENSEKVKSSIWVLNPKALPTYLKNAPVHLKPDQVSQLSFHLSRFIRRTELEREEIRRSPFRKDKGTGSQIGL